MRKRFTLAIALLATSCSGLKTSSDAPVKESSEDKTLAGTVKRSEIKYDSGRLVGSASITDPSEYHRKAYFLYGAEHLNLENYYFDIPVVYNDAVKKWINYFLNRGRGFFERYSERAGRYAPIMGKILEDMGMPRDLIFLAMAESGFQNKAKSWARAVGPWQFMPYTGRRYGLAINWYLDERRDPIKSTIAAGKYLKKLYEDFGAWELAAAAYNAGEGKVGRAIRRYKTENFWSLREGRYLKVETKNYVPKIMALAIIGKNLKSFGFHEIEFNEPLDFEEITVAPGSDLVKLALDIEVDFEEIQRLNPEILRWVTPPGTDKYPLRVPVGFAQKWQDCCLAKEYLAADFQKYKVQGKSTTLWDVASKFKIKRREVLADLNGLKWNQRLSPGQEVILPFREGQGRKVEMYADLYEMPRKSVVSRRHYKNRIHLAKMRGKMLENARTYVVQKGDSLWTVAKKTGTQLDNLIVTNFDIVSKRQIREGDHLLVRQ